MAGANALKEGQVSHPLPQARHPEQSPQFTQFHNYVALPRSEAFRIEYWALEEAKLQRMPAEAEFSRKIALVIGGASGIGREVALLLGRRGAHVVVADFDQQGASKVADEVEQYPPVNSSPQRPSILVRRDLCPKQSDLRFHNLAASTSLSIPPPSIQFRGLMANSPTHNGLRHSS